ncbi:hypothetical protein [Amycolatopsis sp. GM8]|uniref:hypothetical protein n=1 Tax=Amycolatopsis sp. GM8 TaxID=2896530 RepID=UPI001F387034|nr:hypothetical protein [Amycolatopsis sp. GM8]
MPDPHRNLFEGFTALLQSTACPYARLATTRFVPVPYSPKSPDFLIMFRKRQPWLADPGTDALIVAIHFSELGKTIDDHARLFRRLLNLVSDHEIAGNILTPGWQLQIHRTRVFATLFSPLYPARNPRSIQKGTYGYVMLQPEHSFHKLLPRNRLEEHQRVHIKHTIREAFDRSGKPYDALDRQPPTEAQKYVKPLHLGDPMIEWWKY